MNQQSYGFTKHGVIVLRHVRVRFIALYRPAPDFSGKDKYSITCEINEDQLKFLEGEMKKVAEEKWKDRAKALWPTLNKAAKEHTPKNGGPSYLRVTASNNTEDRRGNPIPPPQLFTHDKKPSKLGGPDEIYAGCYVNLYLAPAAYDQGSTGIKFYIRAVEFVEEGPRLGGSSVETDDLDDLTATEELDQDSDEDVSW